MRDEEEGWGMEIYTRGEEEEAAETRGETEAEAARTSSSTPARASSFLFSSSFLLRSPSSPCMRVVVREPLLLLLGAVRDDGLHEVGVSGDA